MCVWVLVSIYSRNYLHVLIHVGARLHASRGRVGEEEKDITQEEETAQSGETANYCITQPTKKSDESYKEQHAFVNPALTAHLRMSRPLLIINRI